MFITLWLLSYWQSFFDTNLQRMTSSLICNEHGSGSNSFMYLTTDMITYLFYNVGSSEHCYSLFLLLRALGIRIASRDAAVLWCSELLQHLSNITLPCFSWLFCFCLRLALSLSFPFLTFCGFLGALQVHLIQASILVWCIESLCGQALTPFVVICRV